MMAGANKKLKLAKSHTQKTCITKELLLKMPLLHSRTHN